jgi:hypothetical protein
MFRPVSEKFLYNLIAVMFHGLIQNHLAFFNLLILFVHGIEYQSQMLYLFTCTVKILYPGVENICLTLMMLEFKNMPFFVFMVDR